MPARSGLALIAPVVLGAGLAAQAVQSREAGWRADLTFFAREFAGAQRDFDKLYPRKQFDDALAALTANIGTNSDAEMVLGLMRLVASARVAHTNVSVPTDGPLAFHRLPIGVQWFSDGLAVTSATEPYRDALGLRVLSIGALPPERLEAAIAPYLSYEIDGWLHQQSQTFMLVEEMLRAAGHVQPDGHVSVALEGSDGSQRLLALKPVPWRDPAPRISASDARQIPIGVARKDPVRFYRYEILPESRTVYVRYTRCANDPQQPFDTFAHELFAAVDASPQAIDRAVIDLRGNAGGDSRIIKPLLDGLRARKALSTRGRLYALVSPGTFSSGLMAAFSLKEDLGAILVGEPPGEKPNSYGEVRQLTLPNSGLVVQYSTKYFTLIKNGDPLRLEPDLVVRRSIAHFLAGRDPVLEAALARPEPLHQGPLAP